MANSTSSSQPLAVVMAPLTSTELEEIQEYQRIVDFEKQVMAGTHPRVKLPQHMLNRNTTKTTNPPSTIRTANLQPSTKSTTKPFVPPTSLSSISKHKLDIDFTHDYYKDLGVQSHVKLDSITRGYNSKHALFSPSSKAGKLKWSSEHASIRRKIKKDWERIEKARKILTDPRLRAMYDSGELKTHLNAQKRF